MNAPPGLFNVGLRGMEPWTFSHGHTDNEALKPAAECEPVSHEDYRVTQMDGKTLLLT